MCTLSKGQFLLSRGTIQNAFLFSELSPFFDLEKLWHFVISLLLLKVLTWNCKYVLTFQRAILTIKGDNSKWFFFRIMSFFDLDFLSSIKHPTAKRWYLHAVLLFPCPTMFSTLPKQNFNFSAVITFSSATALFLDQSESLLFGKSYNFTKQHIFRLVQFDNIYRWPNKYDWNIEICPWIVDAKNPFPLMFSKGLFFKVVKRWDCMVKS